MVKSPAPSVADPISLKCGRRIKRARDQQGWTQARLAYETKVKAVRPPKGLGATRIANYEQGKRRIGYEEAELLSLVFPRYPSAYFLGVVDEDEASMLQIMRQRTRPALVK